MIHHDVLVIGAGLAGQRAALAARQPGLDVAILSKVYPTQSHSGAAQGGFNAAIEPDDRVEDHVFDTVKGSDYLGDQDAVEVMCAEAPKVIAELDRLGVLWSRREDGRIAQRSLGGAGRARTCFAADLSGHVVLHTLFEQLMHQGVRVYSEWHVLELLVEPVEGDRLRWPRTAECRRGAMEGAARADRWVAPEGTGDLPTGGGDAPLGRVVGALCLDLRRGRLEVLTARAVVLATGGFGRVYAKTTNAHICTGDGVALAYRAGAVLSDMEFVQFHPTTLFGSNVLMSEACRGEGGYLRNRLGERFMARYAPKHMELAPRDVVSRAIAMEIKDGRGFEGGYVHLDLTHLGRVRIDERLPQVQELAARYARIDMAREPVPIEPAQHYSMGGIRCRTSGETSLPGLFAAGECGNLSVHGANRLGGNSLLETVVFGRLAGLAAAEFARETAPMPPSAATVDAAAARARAAWGESATPGSPPADTAVAVHRELTAAMADLAGVFRTRAELAEALSRIEALSARYRATSAPGGLSPYNFALVAHLETGYLLDLARVIAAGALRREESRGAHHRLDFPRRDDDRWLSHTFAARGPEGPRLFAGPVSITRYPPQARGY